MEASNTWYNIESPTRHKAKTKANTGWWTSTSQPASFCWRRRGENMRRGQDRVERLTNWGPGQQARRLGVDFPAKTGRCHAGRAGRQDGTERYDQPYCLGLEQIWQGLRYPLQVGSWDYLLKKCLCLLEQKLGIIRTTLWDTINYCLKLNWNWWGLHWL